MSSTNRKYWLIGALIGFCAAIIFTAILTYNVTANTLCLEPPTCADNFQMFLKVLVFLGPIGIILGLIAGLIIEKVRTK